MCLIGLKVSSSGAFSSFVYPFALSLSPFLSTFHGTRFNVSLKKFVLPRRIGKLNKNQ